MNSYVNYNYFKMYSFVFPLDILEQEGNTKVPERPILIVSKNQHLLDLS